MNRRRRSYLIAELSRLSREGWAHATSDEYRAIERELYQLSEEESPMRSDDGRTNGAIRGL